MKKYIIFKFISIIDYKNTYEIKQRLDLKKIETAIKTFKQNQIVLVENNKTKYIEIKNIYHFICINEDNFKQDEKGNISLSHIIDNYKFLKKSYKNLHLIFQLTLSPKYSDNYAFSLNILKSTQYDINTTTKIITKHKFKCLNNQIQINFFVNIDTK